MSIRGIVDQIEADWREVIDQYHRPIGWPTHELNVLKTTEDWPPCSTDADLIVAAVNALPDLFDQLEVAPA